MRTARLLFFFILAVLVIVAALSMLMPTHQKIERSITINAPASVIYNELTKLENFNKYSVWSQNDPSAKYTMTGTDGTVGAASSWVGDPELSGEGKIEITALDPNKSVKHLLTFKKPRSGSAESAFILNQNGNVTTVTWDFKLATPRPWNIFNLFYNLEEKMGKDFDAGLEMMKKGIETMQGTATEVSYAVENMNFPATRFAIVRQKIKWTDLQQFFAEHFPIVYQEAQNANAAPGTASGLVYEWDQKMQLADIAVAVPIDAKAKINNPIVQTVDLPASKAVYLNHSGSYQNLPAAYASIRKYLDENKLKEKFPSIEQYLSGPNNEKDTAKWVTKIIFLVE